MTEFHPQWEARVEKEEIVADGHWFYQNEIQYEVKLVKRTWNYTSMDLAVLDEILEVPFHDYIDFRISDEGVLYHWLFSGPNGETRSDSFSTYYEARDHINIYGYNYQINW